MGPLNHSTRNPNLSVLRWVLSGKLLEPPGAFWGFLGSPGKLLGTFWGLLGLLLGSSWVFLGGFWGPSWDLLLPVYVSSVAEVGSSPAYPGRENADCHSLPRGVPYVVTLPMLWEGEWEW